MALKQLYEFLRLLQGDWEGSSLSGAAQHTQAKEQREAMEFYMAFAFRKKEAQPGSKGRRLNVLKGIFVYICDDCGCTSSNLIWLHCAYTCTWRHCCQKACRFPFHCVLSLYLLMCSPLLYCTAGIWATFLPAKLRPTPCLNQDIPRPRHHPCSGTRFANLSRSGWESDCQADSQLCAMCHPYNDYYRTVNDIGDRAYTIYKWGAIYLGFCFF